MRYIAALLIGILLASPVFVVDLFTTHSEVVRVCQRESFQRGDMFVTARTTTGNFILQAPVYHSGPAAKLYDAIAEGSVVTVEWRGGNALPQLLEKAEPFSGAAPSC